MKKTIAQIVAGAVETAAMRMDGPDEPGYHSGCVTILDADPDAGVVLVQDEHGAQLAYKLQLLEAPECLQAAQARFAEKTGWVTNG